MTVLDDIMSNYEVLFILTDKSLKSLSNLVWKHIKCFAGNPRNGAVDNFLTKVDKVDVLISINYLFLIEDNLIIIPKISFNIHGSLLSKY